MGLDRSGIGNVGGGGGLDNGPPRSFVLTACGNWERFVRMFTRNGMCIRMSLERKTRNLETLRNKWTG